MSVEDVKEVEVLYDYTYSDDTGTVEIQEGDVYKLLEKTNDEWWHVCSLANNNPSKDTDGFFVPAQYVRILKKNLDLDNALSTLDDVLDEEEKRMSEKSIGKLDSEDKTATVIGLELQDKQPTSKTSANGMPEIRKRESDGDDEYVNLAQYRLEANIPSVDNSSANGNESDYANLPYQHAQPCDQMPKLQDGLFVKILVEDMPWDVYDDHSGRRFFHNRDTGELTWKPPRKEKPASPPQKSPVPANDRERSQAERGEAGFDTDSLNEYEQVDENGDVFYVHKATQERDQLSGYLNKAKIAEAGKKKVKKSWNQTFVVLQSSNLVFYKDSKAAAQKPGSPHGRPEGVISLLGAKISFNPPREFTSKRNTILVCVSQQEISFFFKSEDEKLIHEFLFRMKMVANDISQDLSPRDTEGTLSRPGITRSQSSEEGSLGVNMDKGRSMVGIKAKLLNFISRRPTQEDLVKRGIIKDSVFGSTLQNLCERDKCSVPTFVLECITAVENKGLDHDGLYRISGNLAEIQRLRYVIDKDDTHNLMDPQWDIHTLTGALKLFFRELKEPLFPFKSVNKFLDAARKETSKEKLKAFKEALASLPKSNFETMRVLFQHLKNVVHFSQENRMQVQNVAIVFGPTLMWAEGDLSNMAVLTMCQSRVVEYMLLEYDALFQ
ncbi:hypothetical protein C0Q70_09961 [Pomacea canaliculata]|uniref:Rho GTPase-activating protein 12 n=1 Tax=Pomacea canaliculata TaxID=400727 RepID=A0A2T7PB94_POMCA|nr:hypothetical protein C0Q70_09961 [Pomacea canaliculata]